MKILDLFAGLGGELRRKEIEALGHEYVTLDIDPQFDCNITADIMDIHDLGLYDFVWASVPCETWSVAAIGHHWQYVDGVSAPKTAKAEHMIELVKHTIILLQESAKYAWVIENPRGMLRKMPFMQEIRRHTVTYCQYGDTRMKPTDIWTCGLNWNPRPMCHKGDSCHVSAPRGSKTGTQGMRTAAERSVVPLALWKEILDSLEVDITMMWSVNLGADALRSAIGL